LQQQKKNNCSKLEFKLKRNLCHNTYHEFLSIGMVRLLTQLPFEIKTTMPATNKGKRGYSDDYVAQAKRGVRQTQP
jgi:hypothetical protein